MGGVRGRWVRRLPGERGDIIISSKPPNHHHHHPCDSTRRAHGNDFAFCFHFFSLPSSSLCFPPNTPAPHTHTDTRCSKRTGLFRRRQSEKGKLMAEGGSGEGKLWLAVRASASGNLWARGMMVTVHSGLTNEVLFFLPRTAPACATRRFTAFAHFPNSCRNSLPSGC